MADLITTKAAFPKSGGLAVANGAVSVNAGNGLHVNPTTGMVEVPVDTTAGLGYGSNGLEVEVDGSTIDFNSSGQLTALGGGGGDATTTTVKLSGIATSLGNWSVFGAGYLTVIYGDEYFIPISLINITRYSSPQDILGVYYGDELVPNYSGYKRYSTSTYWVPFDAKDDDDGTTEIYHLNGYLKAYIRTLVTKAAIISTTNVINDAHTAITGFGAFTKPTS